MPQNSNRSLVRARRIVRVLLARYVLMRRVAADPTHLLTPADVLARRRLGVLIRPEVSLTARVIAALRREGIGLRVTGYLHAPPGEHPADWNPAYAYGPTADEPVTRPGWNCVPGYAPHPNYHCYVDADDHNLQLLGAGLRLYWNRAMGLGPSRLRFTPPPAADGPELDRWGHAQRARLARAGRPRGARKPPPRTYPAPRFVIAINTERAVVQVRWSGLSRPVALRRHPGVQRLFQAIVKAQEKYVGRLPPLPPVARLDEVRDAFAKRYAIVVSCAELAAFCFSGASDTERLDFDEVVEHLTLAARLDKTARARVRQLVHRLNKLFRAAAGHTAGYILRPQGDGSWLLQAPVFRTPDEKDGSRGYKHPARTWDTRH